MLCRLVLSQIVLVLAEASTTAMPLSICLPFGECEPCPSDALHEPFCQPFGNRRLMHCSPNHTTTSMEPLPSWYPSFTPSPPPIQGETPAWQSCGRIVAQERADFYEFLGYNLLVAAVALSVALVRSRTVEARQARRLAARIGLVRSPMVDAR
ncbi:hypothetical protein J3R82DRAFT_6581 [Butyriboletus roseoflavus]|nr:hypothetical protein J3R82DRAFT_6581 [Butyriboletus roseoflavus]